MNTKFGRIVAVIIENKDVTTAKLSATSAVSSNDSMLSFLISGTKQSFVIIDSEMDPEINLLIMLSDGTTEMGNSTMYCLTLLRKQTEALICSK